MDCVSRATSNIEDAIFRFELGYQFPGNSENQPISRPKPKMTIFDLGQLFEEGWIVSARRDAFHASGIDELVASL
jgi:hypothetical protein